MKPNDPDAPGTPVGPSTNESRAVQEAVRGLAAPEPGDAFRARLRQDFVTGRIAALHTPRRAWFVRPFVWIPAAAAAAALVVALANQGPAWQVVSVNGTGRVIVGGTAFEPSQRSAIASAVARGGEVRTEGALTLDLIAPGMVALAIAPGSHVWVPAAPARWWSRHAELRVESGDLYVSTGRAFHGATLDVQTATAIARCVGTSFAVLSVPSGTCVCVLEGQVNVAARSEVPGAGVAVPHGMRRVIDHAGHGETLPILEDSVHHLHHQLSSVGTKLER